MSTDTPQDLLKQWHAQTLPVERAQGQTLQHLKILYQQLGQTQTRHKALNRAIQTNQVNWANLKTEVDEIQCVLSTMQTDLKRLLDHAGLPPTKPPNKRGRPRKGA